MAQYADLHIHTYYSDSTSSPQEVIDLALQKDLHCISITDHDTIDGIKPALKAAKDTNIEILSGIELSSEYQGRDIHILGYLVDIDNSSFNKELRAMQETRVERMKLMIDKLKELGIDNIELDEIMSITKSSSVGRPHLAKLLVEKGWVKNIKTAFDKYLAEGAPAYISKDKKTPLEVIDMINQAGGIAVLAHPMVTSVDEMIPHFVRSGLKGIEVYYPNTNKKVIEYYKKIAKKHNLLITGGSDAHGDAKVNTFIGKTKISYSLVEDLKRAVNHG